LFTARPHHCSWRQRPTPLRQRRKAIAFELTELRITREFFAVYTAGAWSGSLRSDRPRAERARDPIEAEFNSSAVQVIRKPSGHSGWRYTFAISVLPIN